MEKAKISEEVKEQYLDASVSMFMEQYAALSYTETELVEGNFPEELDARCRTLIKREQEKHRRKQILRRAMRVCRSAAVLVLALLGLGGTLFLGVESIRLPLINKYIEWKGGYVEISSSQDEVVGELDLNDPLRHLLPDEFVLDTIINQWHHGTLMAIYKSPNANVNLFVEDINGVTQIDTEDAVITEISVMGREVLMITEGDSRELHWVDEQQGLIFTLQAQNVSETFLADICTEVIMLFE